MTGCAYANGQKKSMPPLILPLLNPLKKGSQHPYVTENENDDLYNAAKDVRNTL